MSDKEVAVNDDVTRELPVNDVTQSAECANQTPEPVNKDRPTAIRDSTRTPEVARPEVSRHGDNMALLEVSSLGDRERGVMSPPSPQDVFNSRTCAVLPRTGQPTHRVGPPPLYRHVTPFPVVTSAVRPTCSEPPRSLRYAPPPPPPPPPLPGHVMRLFATSKSTCPGPSASALSTAGRPVRFPRMGHAGLATNTSHRMTLQAARPDHFQL